MSIAQTYFSLVPVSNEPSTYYTEDIKDSVTTQRIQDTFIKEFKKEPTIYQNSEFDELGAYLLQDSDASEFDLLQHVNCSNDTPYTENNHTTPTIPKFLETLKDCIKNSSNKRKRKKDPYPINPRKKHSLEFRKKVINEVCYMNNLKAVARKHRLSINKIKDFVKGAIRQPSIYISKLEKQNYTVDNTASGIIANPVLAGNSCANSNQDRNAFLNSLKTCPGSISAFMKIYLE